MNVTTLSSHPRFQNHAGYKFRDQWLGAVSDADMSPPAYRTAIRLYLAFNCQTGRCDPKFETIATELGVHRRTVERGVSDLEKAGLLIPSGRGSRRQFVLCNDGEVPTAYVGTVPTETAKSSDRQCGGTREHLNTDRTLKKRRAAPRSACVDSFSHVTDDADPFR